MPGGKEQIGQELAAPGVLVELIKLLPALPVGVMT